VNFGCLLAILLACYGAALFAGKQFAYRDAAHYYYPLYQRVQQEWDAGRVPLWEPEENGGMPLLGNPTAAVLYPGKVVYALLPYDWAARVYIVAHTGLAFASMWWLLRYWRISRTGASLGALSYAFGAPVIFQYCNVIFLVSAAWSPLGLLGTDLWLRRRRRWGIVLIAIVLAMQVLGGDPQSAYVIGLCAGGYALGLSLNRGSLHRLAQLPWLGITLGAVAFWIAATLFLAHWIPIWFALPEGMSARQARPWPEFIPRDLFPGRNGLTWLLSARFWKMVIRLAWAVAAVALAHRWLRPRATTPLAKRTAGLLAAAVLAVLLTGAQLLPVLEFSSRTVRAADDGPHEMYPFSLEPYRVLEYAWPQFFGTHFLANRSWLTAVPPGHAPKIWVPSLYMGGLALILGLAALRPWRANPRQVWLTWIAIGSLVLSFGEFASPLWLARNFKVAERFVGKHDPANFGELRQDGFIADGDGSPYWLCARVLPGFNAFRYPSKLLVFTNLALSGLAAIGWDRARNASTARYARRWALAIVAIGVGLLGVTVVARGPIIAAWKAAPLMKGVSTWGPFDAAGTMHDVQLCLIQQTVIFGACAIVMAYATRRTAAIKAAAVALLTADLIFASAWLVRTVPVEEFHVVPELLRRIQEAEKANPSDGPYRVHRMPLWDPMGWSESVSDDRVLQFVQWERKTLQPKYAIPYHLSYVLTEGVAELYDYWFFFAPFRGNHGDKIGKAVGLSPGEKVVYYPRRGYDLWNTRYFLLPMQAMNTEYRGIALFLSDTVPIYPTREMSRDPKLSAERERWKKFEDWQLLRNKNAYPRAWVVHEARFLMPITDMSRLSRGPWMEEIIYQNDPFWNNPERIVYNPQTMAWVEIDNSEPLIRSLSKTMPTDREKPVISRYDPDRVEIDVELESPGIIILADVFYPGWKLTINDKPAEILCVNRMMRGAFATAGKYHLVYRYEPESFRIGLWLTAAGALGLVGMMIGASRQARRGNLSARPVKERTYE
jgi:hypothetical protein